MLSYILPILLVFAPPVSLAGIALVAARIPSKPD